MFNKNIDSILKKVNKIVQELRDVKTNIDTKIELKDEALNSLGIEKKALVQESSRASVLLHKWEEMV